MMETLNFRDLVKMIHPDTNPGITDAGEKMVMAKKHRDNPSFLLRLAIQWGLVKGSSSSYTTSNQGFSGNYDTGNNEFIFEAGNVVRIYYRTKMVDAVIVGFEKGKGKRKGFHKVLIADISTARILYFYTHDLNSKKSGHNIFVQQRKPTDYEKSVGFQIYHKYKEDKRWNENVKKERKRQREERTKENLRPHTRYWNENVFIFARTLNRMVRVTRTTAKRVYYWDTYQDKERFVNMSSVTKVYRKDENGRYI